MISIKTLFKLTVTVIVVALLLLCIAAAITFYTRNRTLNFVPLPTNNRTAEISRNFLSSRNTRNFKSIQEMMVFSDLVIKAEVIKERTEILGIGDTSILWNEYTIHTLNILKLYRNRSSDIFQVGDNIEILQYNRLSNRESWLFSEEDMIRSDIRNGDIIIIFLKERNNSDYFFSRLLRPQHSMQSPERLWNHNILRNDINLTNIFILSNQIQAVYYYNEYLNVFESVNPYNNLILTREDLNLIYISEILIKK